MYVDPSMGGMAVDPAQSGMVPVPGQSHYPPQFTYGVHPGYQQGMMGGIARGTQGMIAAIPVGVEAAAMASRIGMAYAGGAGIAGMAGAGIFGGSIAGMAGTAALGLGAYQMSHGVAEQMALTQQLGGYNFSNATSMTGRGFSFEQMNQIGTVMRQFDQQDPYTRMQDLNQLLGRFSELDMDEGVRNAKEFASKFEKFANSVRDIAIELGTSLDDASRVFGQMRQIGFYDSADVQGNVRNLNVARSLGMEQQDYMGMQAGASGVTRAQSMTGSSGATAAARAATDLLIGSQDAASGGMGLYSAEHLMDITGETSGGRAAAQLGQRWTTSMTNLLMGGPVGQATLMAFGEQDESGRFTGGIDRNMVARAARGEINERELTAIAGRKTRSRQSQTSFLNSREDISSALLEDERGAEAAWEIWEQSLSEKYANLGEDRDLMVKLFRDYTGANQAEAELFVERMDNIEAMRRQRMQRARQEAAASIQGEQLRRYGTTGGVVGGIAGTVEDALEPLAAGGMDALTGGQNYYQRIHSGVFGYQALEYDRTQQQQFQMDLLYGRESLQFEFATGDRGRADITRGTALHGVSESSWSSTDIGRAEDVLRKVRMGQAPSAAELGLSADQQSTLRRRLVGGAMPGDNAAAAERRQQGRAILAKVSRARALGDSAAEAEAREEFRKFVGSEALPGLATSGIRARDQAAVAFALGNVGVGAGLLTEGEIGSTDYADMAALEAGARSVLGQSGSGITYESLRESGGNVVEFMSSEGGPGRSGFDQLLEDEEVGTLAQSYLFSKNWEGFARLFNKKYNRNFSPGDVQSAYEFAETLKGRTQQADGMVGGRFGLAGAAYAYISGEGAVIAAADADENFSAVGRAFRSQTQGGMLKSTGEAVRGTLAGASRRQRAALGNTRFDRLQAAAGEMAKGSAAGAEAYRAAITSITENLDANSLDGVLPGFASIARMMDAAQADDAGLYRLAGVTDEAGLRARAKDLRMGGIFEDGLDDDERRRLITALGEGYVHAELSQGAGSGVWTRGMTAEQAMIQGLDTSVNNTLQATSDLVEIVKHMASEMDIDLPQHTAQGVEQ